MVGGVREQAIFWRKWETLNWHPDSFCRKWNTLNWQPDDSHRKLNILNWQPDSFLTADKSKIICASHGAIYDIASGECVAGPCRGKKLNSIKCGVHEGLITVFIPINVL